MSLFPSIFLYHFRFIFVWRVRRTFFPSFRMVFFYVLPCDHGRDFFTSIYVRIQSINQSHGESTINRADHPISYYPDKLVVVVVVVVSHIQRIGCQPEKTTLHGGQSRSYQDGKLEHRGDFTQEADLVRKIFGAHGECQMIAEVHDIRRNGGGRELCGGAGKIIVDGVFPGRPSWWYSPESRWRASGGSHEEVRGKQVELGPSLTTCHGYNPQMLGSDECQHYYIIMLLAIKQTTEWQGRRQGLLRIIISGTNY